MLNSSYTIKTAVESRPLVRRMGKCLCQVLFLLFLASCTGGTSEVGPVEGSGIVGSWRLYETGLSPGAGYYVTPVPSKPPQILIFTSDGRIQKQGKRAIEAFQQANYYRIDSTNYGLALWTKKLKSDTTEYYYYLSFQANTIRLAPPCIEGCHLGFIRTR